MVVRVRSGRQGHFQQEKKPHSMEWGEPGAIGANGVKV
jgi:hypothetical protein